VRFNNADEVVSTRRDAVKRKKRLLQQYEETTALWRFAEQAAALMSSAAIKNT